MTTTLRIPLRQHRGIYGLTVLSAFIIWNATPACAQEKGLQLSPDGAERFVNKDVSANERWAITLNGDDGTVTGNVFFQDGRDPAFIVCNPLDTPTSFSCFGANSCSGSEAHGVQVSPDGRRIFVNKDIGDQRWAITLNQASGGTVTGNVFFRDGRDPAFVFCSPLPAANAFRCFGANSCEGDHCAQQYTLIGDVTIPSDFFSLPNGADACASQYQFISNVDVPMTFFAGSAVCGNGITEGNEACDGDDRGICVEGACQSNCACAGDTEILHFIKSVSNGATGTTGRIDVGVSPVPDRDAPHTIAGVKGQIAGGGADFTIPFAVDGTSAPARDDATTHDAKLILVAVKPDGTVARGFFELPLPSTDGLADVRVNFADGVQPTLRVATLIDGVVSTYVTTTIAFEFAADTDLDGIDVRAEYHPIKGSFVGLADQVSCITNVHDMCDVTGVCVVVFNNCVAPVCHRQGSPTDTDSLVMLIAAPHPLPFPIRVACIFQANDGQVVTPADIHAVVDEVTTVDAVVGNPADLGVSVEVQSQF